MLLEAFAASLGLMVSHQLNQKMWRSQLKQMGLVSSTGISFGGQGYELLVLELLQKVERNAGWESVEGYHRTIQALQRNIIRPLKVEKFADNLKPGILLRGLADECEQMIRAIATEFNGNMVRVDAFDLLNCFYVRSLFRVIKKLRPVIVVVDNADIVLQEASGYPKAHQLKMKLLRRWPTVEDQICLIASTNLSQGLDRGFIMNTFKVSIDVSQYVRSSSPPPAYYSRLSDEQVDNFKSYDTAGPSGWKAQSSSIAAGVKNKFNHLMYPQL
ncbi:hypothetical protein M3Y94_01053100 [Aphelenchoides besseyi]|nr:hypothetical protein M3Y94_01053100 [Aphelenchoides besseyi]KAI6224107.1 hypothetical protein M3Y95_00848400 [Aphelenchoides besseyi]